MTQKEIHIRTRAIIFHEGKLFVVKHGPDSDFYALPGGHMEFGENIQESLIREIEEEFGVRPEIGRLLFVNNFIDSFNSFQSIEFFFEVINTKDFFEKEKFEGTHSFEIFDFKWADRDFNTQILPKELYEDLKSADFIPKEVVFYENSTQSEKK